MYDTKDLLARIQNGEDPEAIANEFAAALNGVIELNRKQKEEEAAKALANQKEDKLNALAQTMIDTLMEYVTVSNPNLAQYLDNENIELGDVQLTRKTLDAAIKSAALAIALLPEVPSPSPNPTPSSTSNPTPDQAIEKFLKMFID